jgi:hypothetical protein
LELFIFVADGGDEDALGGFAGDETGAGVAAGEQGGGGIEK